MIDISINDCRSLLLWLSRVASGERDERSRDFLYPILRNEREGWAPHRVVRRRAYLRRSFLAPYLAAIRTGPSLSCSLPTSTGILLSRLETGKLMLMAADSHWTARIKYWPSRRSKFRSHPFDGLPFSDARVDHHWDRPCDSKSEWCRPLPERWNTFPPEAVCLRL